MDDKMIEQQLESIVVNMTKHFLRQFDGLKVVGAWQTTKGDENKAEERPDTKVVIGVKALPRTYETPTIPHAEIQIQMSLAVRADTDFNGKNYLNITTILSNMLQRWQSDITTVDEFAISNQFDPTGFQLTGGDCGMDKDAVIWQWQQTFSIYGIIHPSWAE